MKTSIQHTLNTCLMPLLSTAIPLFKVAMSSLLLRKTLHFPLPNLNLYNTYHLTQPHDMGLYVTLKWPLLVLDTTPLLSSPQELTLGRKKDSIHLLKPHWASINLWLTTLNSHPPLSLKLPWALSSTSRGLEIRCSARHIPRRLASFPLTRNSIKY